MTSRILRFLNIDDGSRQAPPTATGTVLIALLIAFGAVMCFLSVISLPKYQKTIAEDGIIESLSAVFWALAATVVSGTLCTAKGKTKYFTGTYVFLLIFFIVCGGEEMSWGQRIFGFRGPEALRAINKQHETNLHNIGSISLFANAFFFLYLLCYWYYPRQTRTGPLAAFARDNNLPVVTRQAIVIAIITLIIWLLLGVRFGTLGFSPLSVWGYYPQMDDEVFEVCAAYSYFVVALLDLQAKNAGRLLAFKVSAR